MSIVPSPNRSKIFAYCDRINKKQGEGMLFDMSDKNAALKIPRWSTGIEDLDAILGGGMPYGRIIEIFGAESSGKTSLLHHLTAQHEFAVNIPIEGTFDFQRAMAFGNKITKTGEGLRMYRAQYGEDCFNKIDMFCKLGMPLIGVDSVPFIRPKSYIDKLETDAEKDKAGGGTFAPTAQIMSQRLPQTNNLAEASGTTVIFINQIRDLINAMPFGEQIKTPGGRTLLFAASVRIKVARRDWIKIPNYNPATTAEQERIGIVMKMRVEKSKVCNPYGECLVGMFFDRGFVAYDDYKNVRLEIMAEKKEFYKKKENQKVHSVDEFADDWEGDADDWE